MEQLLSQVDTALMIRDLIAAAPATPSIGFVATFSAKKEAGSDTDSMDSEDNTTAEMHAFRAMRGSGADWAATMILKRQGVTVFGKPFESAEALYRDLRLNVSGYGDAKTQTTVVDETVRRSKDTSAFSVPDALLADLAHFWTTRLDAAPVVVKPYKINVYGPGDFFKRHLDTPDADLIGTIVVGLPSLKGLALGPDASESESGTIVATQFASAPALFDHWEVVGFYTSVAHAVLDVKEYRATLAFKVYRGGDDRDDDTSLRHSIAIARWISFLPRTFGIVFAHPYNADVHLRGIDREVYAFLETGGFFVEQIPVVVDAEVTGWDDEDDGEKYSGCASVHPLVPTKWTRVPFWHLGDTIGETWSSRCQEYIEHTGNESQPYNKKSIYMSIAVVCQKK